MENLQTELHLGLTQFQLLLDLNGNDDTDHSSFYFYPFFYSYMFNISTLEQRMKKNDMNN